MYEKHIDTLRIMIGKCGTDGQVEAINAAIALMRAAEPRDEASEQVECDAYACCMEGDPLVNSPHVREARAAARAEVAAQQSRSRECGVTEPSNEERREWERERQRYANDPDPGACWYDDLTPAIAAQEARAAARAEVEAKYAAEIQGWKRDYEYQRQLADDADAAVGDMQDELEAAHNWIRDLEARRDIDAELLEARAALRTPSENEGRLQAQIAELETRLQRANETEYDRGFAAASGLRLADQAARAEAEAELTAATARDASWKRGYARGFEAARTTLSTKLAAANARIAELERLRADKTQIIDQAGKDMQALQTKLTNLRAAAERMCTDLDDRSEDGPLMPGQASCLVALRAAIEASK